VAQAAGVDTAPALAQMRQIIEAYAKNGVPADLVDAAKRSEIAQAEFEQTSIPGLANVWSNVLAAEGRNSPDEDVEAIRKVTLADVNRVARQYLLNVNTITATLIPKPTGEPVAAKGFGGGEEVTSAPTKPVALPTWAASALEQIRVPQHTVEVSDSTLPNGIRLIVRRDTTTPTITVMGSIEHNDDLQTSPGKEGVSNVLEGLFSFGTTTLDRLAFQKALDDITATESAGFQFSLNVLKDNFSRGVQLLADNELHPALPSEGFAVVQAQTAQFVAGDQKSPGYRTSRALHLALLPQDDPALREATAAKVSKLTLDDVRQYFRTTVRPDLTTIVVIGDVTPEEAKDVIGKRFGQWKPEGPKPETTLPPVPHNKPSSASVADLEQVQDSVVLAEELPLNRFDPDYYSLQLGTHVLGGGFYATRLYRDLRQTAGYVYTVDVALNATKSRATYEVQYGCDPANVSKARTLIERDLNQMRTQLVPLEELHQAKALLLRQIPLAESSDEGVARGMLSRAMLGLPLDEPLRAAQKYVSITADDIRASFASHIHPADLVQVVRGPEPQ
jgi:zinc protease